MEENSETTCFDQILCTLLEIYVVLVDDMLLYHKEFVGPG